MTWGELKLFIETKGVTDETEVGLIDIECYEHDPVESIHIDVCDGEFRASN